MVVNDTQKAKTQATLPLSDKALSYCGEQGRGMVFKGLSRAHTHEPFKKWFKDAGIKKEITFHELRHCNLPFYLKISSL